MNLSERIRSNSEAAPWVCEEVIKLEAERDRLREKIALMPERVWCDICDAWSWDCGCSPTAFERHINAALQEVEDD